MKNIVILDQKTLGEDVDISIFKEFGQLKIYETTLPQEVEERVENAEIIILNKVVLHKDNLKKAKKLQLICLLATGYNNVDIDYCKNNNIAVCNVAGYSTNSVCQHTFALTLSLIEHIKFYDDFVKSGEYASRKIATNHDMPYFELYDKIWGIVGMGNIGKAVAKVASAFGCKVIYYSTTGNNLFCENYERVDLEALLKQSDIISFHCPLNEKTNNLIKKEELEQMKKSAIIVNMARGGVIIENDLLYALKNNMIKGAAIDVFSKEPLEKNSAFTDEKISEKLVLAPHIAWASIEARERLVSIVYENIKAFYNNEKINRIV